MKRLTRSQGIAASALIIMTTALYFATGYGVGLKLDDNQLISYVLAGLVLGCLAFLVEIWFGRVNFNEAFWYFIPGVLLISVIVLVESVMLFFQPLLAH